MREQEKYIQKFEWPQSQTNTQNTQGKMPTAMYLWVVHLHFKLLRTVNWSLAHWFSFPSLALMASSPPGHTIWGNCLQYWLGGTVPYSRPSWTIEINASKFNGLIFFATIDSTFDIVIHQTEPLKKTLTSMVGLKPLTNLWCIWFRLSKVLAMGSLRYTKEATVHSHGLTVYSTNA